MKSVQSVNHFALIVVVCAVIIKPLSLWSLLLFYMFIH